MLATSGCLAALVKLVVLPLELFLAREIGEVPFSETRLKRDRT